MERWTYNTLKSNRENLIRDCKSIAENIDDYKGEILYLNYDIGTGKTTAVAENIAAKIYSNKKILILVYSYLIAKEWKQKITAQDPLAKIFVLSNPMNEFSKCLKKNKKHTAMSLHEFDFRFCRENEQLCDKIHDDCPGNYEERIDKSEIVITSNQLFLKNQGLFKGFDVIIFDEVYTLDLSTDKSLPNFKCLYELENFIKCEEFSSDSYLKIKKLYLQFEKCNIMWKTTDPSQLSEGDNYFKTIPLTDDLTIPIDYLKKLKKKIIDDRKCNLNYFLDGVISDVINKSIDTIKDLIALFTDSNCTYIYPKMIYQTKERKGDGRPNYKVDDLLYLGASMISKNRFNINHFLDHKTQPSVVLVLSALNTKDYIEYIFLRKIEIENCFGHKILNIFPNVITTNYLHMRHEPNKRFKPYTSKTKSYYQKEYDRNQLSKTIKAFVQGYKNDKVVIAGSKDLYQIIKDQFDKAKDSEINLLQYNIYKKRKPHIQAKAIPFIHFGMSGTNAFANFRAMLVINEFKIPEYIFPLYTVINSYKDDILKITPESVKYNLQIAPMRQLEGRLLRFTDTVIVKYIHRLNYYDLDLNKPKSLPELSTPYMVFKQFESLKNYFRSREDVKNYKSFIRNSESKTDLSRSQHIQTSLWESLYRNKPEIFAEQIKNKSKSMKELFFLIKMIESLLKAVEVRHSIDEISKSLHENLFKMINLEPRSAKKRIETQLFLLENIDLDCLCIEILDNDFIKSITANIRKLL